MWKDLKDKANRLAHFLSYDIWRLDNSKTSSSRLSLYNVIKSFILAYRNTDVYRLNTRASALTYNTLLSIVPMLAVLFAIARGFGFQNIVQSELFSYFESQQSVLEKAMTFVEKSLEYASGGVFLGVGIILLLYTVINLISNIEGTFNLIWGVNRGRTYFRQFTDYTALFLITPVFIICNAGLSIVLNSSLNIVFIGTLLGPVISIVPYLITILLLTIIYIYIPNTKVQFSSALFGAIFAGIAFQLFQEIYISGQIWISKYNAIYGSFAALPLLLLWLQLSWSICMIGVELSFAHQNVEKFAFQKEVKMVSRRYKDFLLLVITSLIIKRFDKGEEPYTANELSESCKIPTLLTGNLLLLLCETKILVETPTDEDMVFAYVPAIDINKITINYLFDRIDLHGSEDFKVDKDVLFKNEWDVIGYLREVDKDRNILIKDI